MGAQQHQQLQGKNNQIGSPASSCGGPSSQATTVSGYGHRKNQPSKGEV
jgi:hypothetical protein